MPLRSWEVGEEADKFKTSETDNVYNSLRFEQKYVNNSFTYEDRQHRSICCKLYLDHRYLKVKTF